MNSHHNVKFAPIPFPALVSYGGELIATGSDFMKISGARYYDNNIISLIEPIGVNYNWIIDANGEIRNLVELERYRKIPYWMKRFVNFTRIRYEVELPRKLTIFELRKITEGAKSWFKEDLNNVFVKYDGNEFLTRDIFLYEIMRERPGVIFQYFPGLTKMG